MIAWLRGNLAYDLALACTFAVILPLELIAPRQSVPASARLKAILFWLAWTPFTVTFLLLGQAAWTSLGIKPLIGGLAPPGLPRPVAVVVGAIAAAFVGDFFYYWCHRAQHRFFWRFHAVHHSVRTLSGVSAYHHISEEAFKIALYSLPVGLFSGDPMTLPVMGTLLGLQGHYLHSVTRLNLGPLARVIQDNRFHRIHLSVHPEHFDMNFGVFTTLWDCVFGTAYFPKPGEWPDTGLADQPEPETVAEFYLAPFRRRTSIAGGGALIAVAPNPARRRRHSRWTGLGRLIDTETGAQLPHSQQIVVQSNFTLADQGPSTDDSALIVSNPIERPMHGSRYAAYEAASPYFELVRGALGDLVDGEHFFDVVADDIEYEVLYAFPGWPRLVRGRDDLMARFASYGDNIELRSADNLVTHRADDGRTIVLEYEVHGTIRASGASYDNRFASILTIANRKLVHWRDYMDSLAAWNAATARPHQA